MAAVLPLMVIVFILMIAVVARLSWFREERRKLIQNDPGTRAERIEPECSENEHDRTYSGRVIRKLRVRLIKGGIEIDWQFNPEYIHRGFMLTGKNRRNDSGWEPLAFEPHQDSGSWEECFNYGESRSYLFTVKKKYFFFFGLIQEEGFEIVYDQISFAVRKGRLLKERKEELRDHREVIEEEKALTKAAEELRVMLDKPRKEPELQSGQKQSPSEFERRLNKLREIDDKLEALEAEILAHSTWSEERKQKELERVRDLADEMRMKAG